MKGLTHICRRGALTAPAKWDPITSRGAKAPYLWRVDVETSHTSDALVDLDCEVVKALKGVGHLLDGFQSGNDAILKKLRKALQQNKVKREHAKKAKIAADLIFGLLRETKDEVEQTLRFVNWCFSAIYALSDNIYNYAQYKNMSRTYWKQPTAPFPALNSVRAKANMFLVINDLKQALDVKGAQKSIFSPADSTKVDIKTCVNRKLREYGLSSLYASIVMRNVICKDVSKLNSEAQSALARTRYLREPRR
jgi:hypothetical protein